ncbi:MAG: phage terminase large subunit family protein [Kiloniellales bacterium]|nr:phage terminase large subunit family protein [Kiloniellales bacterium]
MKRISTLSLIALALGAGIAPDPVVVPHSWASDNIVVPDGPMAGSKWSPDLAPYLKEPLDLLAPEDPENLVVVRKSAQTGFTGVGISWLGLIAMVAPAKTLVVLPTVDAAKEFNREKLQPTIEASPHLAATIAEQKSRAGRGSTMLTKVFPGGSHVITGANSTVGLRSKTVKNALCDEVDDYPLDLDGQGDPMNMIEARQMAFLSTGSWKRLVGSTPTLEGASRIDAMYDAGDQRQFHVPCPQCGEEQVLDDENLRHEESFPYRAHMICAVNGCVIEHRHKARMLSAGRWVAQKPSPGRHPSFEINALYSPFVTWDDYAKAKVNAEVDATQAKTFENLWRGRSYKVKGDAPEWVELQKRAASLASHARGEVPVAALFLTMGVDVQADRLEASIWGFGIGKTSWLIDHIVLPGDTNAPDVWGKLTELWQRSFPTSVEGQIRRVECVAVDSGYRPTMAYDWTRGKPGAISVKGASARTDWPIGSPKKMTYTARGTLAKRSALNWLVGSWYLKAEIYGCLSLTGPNEAGAFPPGFVFLPTGLDDEVFKQLVAEKLVPRQTRNGLQAYEWQLLPGHRNEVLDCAVYARAAAYQLGMATLTLEQWQQIAAERGAPPEAAQLDLLSAIAGRPPAHGVEATRDRAPMVESPDYDGGWLDSDRKDWI